MCNRRVQISFIYGGFSAILKINMIILKIILHGYDYDYLINVVIDYVIAPITHL